MSESKRTNSKIKSVQAGVYEAIVVSHLDKTYMGSLLVDVLKKESSGNQPEKIGTSIEARYLMPFYGTTPYSANQANDGYSVTQKSYGMWMVPPDVGTRVLVMFVEEDISRCYWIGCIPDQYINFMVPDGRASTVQHTAGTPTNLAGKKLPVGEFNRKVESGTVNDATRFNKPFNKDFTQVLEVQGLIDDENRGTTTTSARREVPSAVFGVNTPGPLDKRNGAPRSLQGQERLKANVFSNRLGGSSFVMDDGDDKFLRKTTADAGPPEYVSKEIGEQGGDPTVPQNELIRLRTRTGHQILMHNSEDLIYIGNARGTSWIEMTSDGKIDIYANDSISVHSDTDINFTASRDVNIEAGRNINMRANARYTDGDDADGTSGNIQIESIHNTNIRVDGNLKVHVEENRDDYIKGNYRTSVDTDTHHYTQFNSYTRTTGNMHLVSETALFTQSQAETNILSNGNVNLQSKEADINLQAAVKIAGDGGPEIYWNSGRSIAATPASLAIDASKVELLKEHAVPSVTPGSLVSGSISSIVRRMPQHEPWVHHENLNPLAFKKDKTDVQVTEPLDSGTLLFTPDTFRKGLVGATDATSERQPSLRVVSQETTENPSEPNAPPAASGPINVPTDLIEYIISKEGFHATPYDDYEQWTNGYGTRARSQTERITREEARRRLEADVNIRRNYVISYGQENGYNWSEEQINALTSFVYNLGTGRLAGLTKGGSRSDEEIMEAIKRYNRAGGEVLAGLVTRRNEESAWFAQGLA